MCMSFVYWLMQLTKTLALNKLRELDKRVRIIRGGSSAGKPKETKDIHINEDVPLFID